jgi:hypothetical protein
LVRPIGLLEGKISAFNKFNRNSFYLKGIWWSLQNERITYFQYFHCILWEMTDIILQSIQGILLRFLIVKWQS